MVVHAILTQFHALFALRPLVYQIQKIPMLAFNLGNVGTMSFNYVAFGCPNIKLDGLISSRACWNLPYLPDPEILREYGFGWRL